MHSSVILLFVRKNLYFSNSMQSQGRLSTAFWTIDLQIDANQIVKRAVSYCKVAKIRANGDRNVPQSEQG
jgi:hypothetical protein